MKKYIKNNNGVALPAVIIMMVVLTILAAGLGTYALNSLERVMYMDTQKQAYYLARAGVETGAYACHQATNKNTTNPDEVIDIVANDNKVDSFLSILKNSDEIIKSDNVIYLIVSTDENANSGTEWQGLEFVAKEKGESAPSSAIGYFTIELVRSQQYVVDNQDSEETTETTTQAATEPVTNSFGEKVKLEECIEIRSTAVCYDDKNAITTSDTKTHISRGYVFPGKSADSDTYCDENGYLINDATKDNCGKNYNGVFDVCSNELTINYKDYTQPVYGYDTGKGFLGTLISHTEAFFKNIYNGIIGTIFKYVSEDLVPIDTFYSYGVYSSSSLTVLKPSTIKSDTLKINENQMGSYVFSAKDLLKFEAGIDVEPSPGKYATIALYGSDIVVDGDINMAVYYIKPSSSWYGDAEETFQEIFSTFGNRYRLGTVVIGASTESGGDWGEYLSVSDGGITGQGSSMAISNANRIFFNGNVSVKIYSQGGGTETYRIFNSGDVCLFNGKYLIDNGKDGKPNTSDDVYGIDLLKFFLDSVVAGAPGYTYGSTTKNKMQAIIDLYYKDSESYIKMDDNGNVESRAIRKLNIDYSTSNVTVDGRGIANSHNGVAYAKYIVQPSSATKIKINWGKPSVSGFDKQSS